MKKQTMGAFISALRKSKGITQKELAEILSVSDKAVSRWECEQTVPDISLLPLIADVFDITVDELIRGARIKNEQPTESQEKNIQKRFESILVAKLNSYKTKSIIPIVLTIIGLIIVFICHSFGYRELGVGISLILFACGISCQIYFLLNFKNSINTYDLNNDTLLIYKKKIFDFSFLIFTIALSLEMLILSVDFHLFWWCGPAGAVGVFFVSMFIKSILVNILKLPFSINEKLNSKLLIKVLIPFTCVIVVLVASMIMINVNCEKWIEKPEVFYVTNSTREIENYIENQFLVGNGGFDYPVDDIEFDNEIKVTITDNDVAFSNVIEYAGFINGYNVNDVERNGKVCKEVKLWTTSTRIKSRSILDNINIVYYILYFVCTVVAISIYIKKLIENRKNN